MKILDSNIDETKKYYYHATYNISLSLAKKQLLGKTVCCWYLAFSKQLR